MYFWRRLLIALALVGLGLAGVAGAGTPGEPGPTLAQSSAAFVD